jgi:hypothetical protein
VGASISGAALHRAQEAPGRASPHPGDRVCERAPRCAPPVTLGLAPSDPASSRVATRPVPPHVPCAGMEIELTVAAMHARRSVVVECRADGATIRMSVGRDDAEGSYDEYDLDAFAADSMWKRLADISFDDLRCNGDAGEHRRLRVSGPAGARSVACSSDEREATWSELEAILSVPYESTDDEVADWPFRGSEYWREQS